MYKYRFSQEPNAKLASESVISKPLHSGANGNLVDNMKNAQNMVYLEDEQMYEQLMEDYNDKMWNDNVLNKSNNVSSPHTLLNPSYYDDK